MKLKVNSYPPRLANGEAGKLKVNVGFGLLEVVISIGILAMVMGAAVYAGRVSLRNNIIANQRSQAYNLVRENLEIIRQMRDSTWVDKSVNDWFTPFKNANFDGETNHNLAFSNNIWELRQGDGALKNLDGTLFSQKIYFKSIDSALNNQFGVLTNSQNFNTVDNPVIINVQSQITWQAYGKEYSVTGAINLTDWKPQI
ncbi:MAG: hypothetical protein ACD_58C00151G0004 [uncultured bacterium]|nr:MAG: hypothetical protein ACD_58C00151G0004 [uncultured bacterium]